MKTDLLAARDAQAEAIHVAGREWQARVLEPSPPSNHDAGWFADDPVATPPNSSSSAPLLPTGLAAQGTHDWSEWVVTKPERAAWVTARWLGGDRALPPTPPDLASTRIALHRLAAYVVAPVRNEANGKFGLRWTLGGFGTPFFADDRQIRVVGDHLVDQEGTSVRTSPITTLRAAAEFLDSKISEDAGAEDDSPPLGDIDEPLDIDVDASKFLGEWFGMAFAALESVRADTATVHPSRPQLWPGHFDPAIEAGDGDYRASYGASPGDQGIDEPYLYVSVWWPDRARIDTSADIWNSPSFTGAVLKLSDFGRGDPATEATKFFMAVRDQLDT